MNSNNQPRTLKFNLNLAKFEKMQAFMVNDLKKATLYGTANFLVAMGVFNYIETLGAFYYPTEKASAKRFNFVFNNLFPKTYLDFKQKFKKVLKQTYTNKNNKTKAIIYDVLRCGLSHEYLIKTSKKNLINQKVSVTFHIFGVEQNDFHTYHYSINNRTCGLELHEATPNKFMINVYLPKLIEDFHLAFEEYKKRLTEKSIYRKNFMKRSEDIDLKHFN